MHHKRRHAQILFRKLLSFLTQIGPVDTSSAICSPLREISGSVSPALTAGNFDLYICTVLVWWITRQSVAWSVRHKTIQIRYLTMGIKLTEDAHFSGRSSLVKEVGSKSKGEWVHTHLFCMSADKMASCQLSSVIFLIPSCFIKAAANLR